MQSLLVAETSGGMEDPAEVVEVVDSLGVDVEPGPSSICSRSLQMLHAQSTTSVGTHPVELSFSLGEFNFLVLFDF